MKCVHCGKTLTDGDLFCSKCGKSQRLGAVGNTLGFRPALDLRAGSAEPEPEGSFACETISEVSLPLASADAALESGSPPAEKTFDTHPVAPIPATEPAKPVMPVIPKRRLVNWKILGCVAVVLVLVIGGVYAIFEGDLFSDTGSKSSNSRRKSDRDRQDDRDYDDYDDYDDDYAGDDPQPSYFDCPGCTNGWHDLCNGTGTYSNYGYSSDCTCDDGICNQCGGEGIIYFN